MLKLWYFAKGLKDKASLLAIRDDESGATMIEYSVLIALLSVLLVVAIGLIGGNLLVQWQALCTALGVVGC
jgi:pilus assembly protein Flp/PilA